MQSQGDLGAPQGGVFAGVFVNLKEENTGNEASQRKRKYLNPSSVFSQESRKTQTESETEKPKVKRFIHISQNFPIKWKLPVCYSKKKKTRRTFSQSGAILDKEAAQDLGAESVKLGKLISTHLSLMKEPLFQSFELLGESQAAIQQQQGSFINNPGTFCYFQFYRVGFS